MTDTLTIARPDDWHLHFRDGDTMRAVVPQSRGQAVAASPLCGGAAPGVAALLHRRDHVELMLFRERTIVGPDAPVDGLCGVWRFRAR